MACAIAATYHHFFAPIPARLIRRHPSWYNKDMEAAPRTDHDLLEQAIAQLKKKRDFPILGWGIGVGANAWEIYARKPISEVEIQRETKRLQG